MAGDRPQDRARQQEQQKQADRLNQARQREKAAKSGDRAGTTFPGIDGQLDLLRKLEKQPQKTNTASETGDRKTRSGEGHVAGSLKAEHQKRGQSSDAVAGSSNLLRRLGDALGDAASKTPGNKDQKPAGSEARASTTGENKLLKQLGGSVEHGATGTNAGARDTSRRSGSPATDRAVPPGATPTDKSGIAGLNIRAGRVIGDLLKSVFRSIRIRADTASKKSDSSKQTDDSKKTGNHDRSVLSAEERAERNRVYHPEGGVGFRHNSTELTSEAKERLVNRLGDAIQQLKSNPNAILDLRGFTSRTGTEATNQSISEERAMAVKRFICDTFGFPADRIRTTGFGEQVAKEAKLPDGKDFAPCRTVDIHVILKPDASSPPTAPGPDAARMGRKLGEGSRLTPDSPKYPPDQGVRDLPDFVDPGNPAKTIAKVAAETAKRLVEALGEMYKRNAEACVQTGMDITAHEMLTDSRPDTKGRFVPQVKDGKPYTVNGLLKRGSVQKKLQDNVTVSIRITPDAEKHFHTGIHRAVDAANGLLKQGSTPEERAALLNAFARAVRLSISVERARELERIKSQR